MKLRFLSLIMLLLASVAGKAALIEPVKWTSSLEMSSDTQGEFVLKADIEHGWHLYGLKLPDDGPRPTKVVFGTLDGVELTGDITPSVAPTEGVDEIFNLRLSWWSASVELRQKFRVKDGAKGIRIGGYVTFQACNDKTCISPGKKTFEEAWGSPVPASSDTSKTQDNEKAVKAPESAAAQDASDTGLWWMPADFKGLDSGVVTNVSQSSWWSIFLWGFLGGLIALLTPCVWPMIPMTVSFFLKKGGSRAKGIRDAIIYGVAIVVIYLVLGLAITLIFDAGKLNELSTNAVFNLLFFLLLVVFAVSFFGAFDIRLPSRWSNATDGKAESTSGLISIFFMAFTLALVSFSCTGPIIGTLLVEAASNGNIIGPAVGMGAFALALAIPFALFALFPSWLKEMPRSGGWLNSVKVVLGFLELALSLKFLSVADLAYGWGILDREVFVSLWIVIFVLLGLYLLGKINFLHDTPVSRVSIPRFFLALVSLSFSIYLLPGLWGAPLKGVSAFVPPLFTQDFNLYDGGDFREFHDFNEGMAYAKKENRPVLLDFSGYGCVNCRKMEGAVFDTEKVGTLVKSNYVLIVLMVDDKTSLPEPEFVEENGKRLKLETYGDKWSYLQRMKFNSNSQPYYVQLDNDGQPVSSPYFYDENVDKFLAWLNGGLEKYKQLHP